MSLRTLARVGAVLLGLLASGLSLAESGAAHSGLVATADAATTAATNPAGMTRLESSELEVELLWAAGDSEWEVTFANIEGDRTDDSDGSAFIPSVYYVKPIGERWRFGVSLSVPGGLGTSFDDGWAGRYFIQEWSLGYIGLTPAFAYKLSKKVSVGAGLGLNFVRFSQESAVFNPEPGIGDGKLEIDADDTAMNAILSVLVEPTPRTRFGFTFRSEFEPELDGDPDYSGLGPIREAQLEQSGALDREVGLDVRLPQALMGGVYHELRSGTSFTFDINWLEFSEFEMTQASTGESSIVEIEQDLEDVFIFTFGVNVPVGDRWIVRAGAMHVTEPVKDENRRLLLRLDRIWGIGGGFRREIGARQFVNLNLGLFDLGDAPVVTQDLPLVGPIEGEYDTHRGGTLVLSWGRKLGKLPG